MRTATFMVALLVSLAFPGCDRNANASTIPSGLDLSKLTPDEFTAACQQSKDCVSIKFMPGDIGSYEYEATYFAESMASAVRMAGMNRTPFGMEALFDCEREAPPEVSVKVEPGPTGFKDLPGTDKTVGRRCTRAFEGLEAQGRSGATVLRVARKFKDQRGEPYVWTFFPIGVRRVGFQVPRVTQADAFLQSPRLVSGRTAGSLAGKLDRMFVAYQAGEYPPDSFLAVTTYRGLGDAADRYAEASEALLKGDAYRFQDAGSTLDDVLAAYNALNLKFRGSAANAGIVPRRTTSEIIDSGYAHCMDAVQVGKAIATQYRIPANMVLTSTLSPTPLFLFAPDRTWLNHVVLYFPSEKKYVDLTAPPGRQVIDMNMSLYRHLGISVPGGNLAVIE